MADTFNLPTIGDAIPTALRPEGLIAQAAGPLPHCGAAGGHHG